MKEEKIRRSKEKEPLDDAGHEDDKREKAHLGDLAEQSLGWIWLKMLEHRIPQ